MVEILIYESTVDAIINIGNSLLLKIDEFLKTNDKDLMESILKDIKPYINSNKPLFERAILNIPLHQMRQINFKDTLRKAAKFVKNTYIKTRAGINHGAAKYHAFKYRINKHRYEKNLKKKDSSTRLAKDSIFNTIKSFHNDRAKGFQQNADVFKNNMNINHDAATDQYKKYNTWKRKVIP